VTIVSYYIEAVMLLE